MEEPRKSLTFSKVRNEQYNILGTLKTQKLARALINTKSN